MKRSVRVTHNSLLREPEIAAEYLSEALGEGDPAVVLLALRNVAEAQEDGISGLAVRSALDQDRMRRLLAADGNPRLSSFTKVIHGLGLRMKVEQDPRQAAM